VALASASRAEREHFDPPPRLEVPIPTNPQTPAPSPGFQAR